MTETVNSNITATESLCPHCLTRIQAERRLEGDDVFLVKNCPEHGEFRTPVWRGEPSLSGWSRPKKTVHIGSHMPLEARGCPFDCGICSGHRQQSCTVLIEVTSRCNLACPFCFAAAGAQAGADPSLSVIERWYRTALEKSGPHNIVQLSGGEATLRNDLPAIITMGRDLGFPYIQLNSNGVRLAADPAYAGELKRAGLFSVFLQFDGTDDFIYQAIRGRALLDEKLKAINNCAAAGLGVVLVPTIVPGVNSENIGAILKLAMELAPGVRGVHFQPASYFGRHPKVPEAYDHLTLPDLMRAIELQTNGLMLTEHFSPPGCEHPLCSFHGNFLRLPSGELKSLTTKGAECAIENVGTGRAVSYVAQQWSAPAQTNCCCGSNSLDAFLENHRTNTFAVSAMAFQDVWNLDLERVQECCIHVVAPDGRMIPFCLYNLTSIEGIPLYRKKSC
ncbi:MAG: radical SAM protein [Desulfuromonadaceae bacterium]|nr:radical SAM protein [Desulfuromonadaceae bacterium]